VLVTEFRVVIADNNQPLILICLVPFPQRGNYSFAVYSTKGPHFEQDNRVSTAHRC
jgi:hypothetical protein